MSTYQPTNPGDNLGSDSGGSDPPSTPSTNAPDITNNATTLRVLTSTKNPRLPTCILRLFATFTYFYNN